MSPAEEGGIRLRRLIRDLQSDRQAMVERAAEVAEAAELPDDPGTNARLAVGLHHYYTAAESLVERALRFLDGGVPDGADWHRALLNEATRPLPDLRPALLAPEGLPEWLELMRFRHFFRHAYAVALDRAQLIEQAARVARLQPSAASDIARLLLDLERSLTRLG